MTKFQVFIHPYIETVYTVQSIFENCAVESRVSASGRVRNTLYLRSSIFISKIYCFIPASVSARVYINWLPEKRNQLECTQSSRIPRANAVPSLRHCRQIWLRYRTSCDVDSFSPECHKRIATKLSSCLNVMTSIRYARGTCQSHYCMHNGECSRRWSSFVENVDLGVTDHIMIQISQSRDSLCSQSSESAENKDCGR